MDAKYHVKLRDPNGTRELGLILEEPSGKVGRLAKLSTPYAAKAGGGDRGLEDLTDLSTYSQADWRGGRGQDKFDHEDRFADARKMETRIEGQATLGPLPHRIGVGDEVAHTFSSISPAIIGTLGGNAQGYAVRFQAPVGGISCTAAILKLRKQSSADVPDYTVALCDDDNANGNYPGSVLKSATLTNEDVNESFEEIQVTWAAESLTGGNYYYIAVYTGAPLENAHLVWAGDSSTGDADTSACNRRPAWTVGGSEVGGPDKIDSSPWAADASLDMWFILNNGGELAGKPVRFERFDSHWWMAAGDTVYYYDSGNNKWQSSDAQAGKTVTDLVTWGSYLWAARGANTMRRIDSFGGSWGDSPNTKQAVLLQEYAGYLYRTNPADESQLSYTADGSDWTEWFPAGPGDWTINALAGYNDQLAIVNDVGLWLFYADQTYQVLGWKSQENVNNGKGLTMWSHSAELFIPIRQGIYRWNGQSMISSGPDQGVGLPDDRAGPVSDLETTVNALFAAIDAGGSGRSSILAYNGTGWHDLIRAQEEGSEIEAMGYEALSSPNRLWWGEGKTTFYAELPDWGDNPFQYEAIEVAADGHLISSFYGHELLDVVKDWRGIAVQVENCTSNHYIEVYYEVDRSDIWELAGTIQSSQAVHTIPLEASDISRKKVASGSTTSTINFQTIHSDVETGDWVTINEETRQVQSITDGDTIILARDLDEAPSAGDYVYGDSPAGYELRVKFRFVTTGKNETPKMMAHAVYCQANVLDRWNITLRVSVGDGLECLDGSKYPYTASELLTRLEYWLRRKTPFVLEDLFGTNRTVKVTNVSHLRPSRNGSELHSNLEIGLQEVDL